MSEVYEFWTCRLDVAERRLWCGGSIVSLRGKVFDTLCVLVAHQGRLVTKDELLARVWPDAIVEENNLATNVTLLRKALRTAGATEPCIETVSGRGYRFTAAVRVVTPDGPVPRAAPVLAAPVPVTPLVERDSELRALQAALERARAGHRALVCLAGEAGIGKTTLLRRFLAELSAHPDRPLVGRGQAVEHVGTGEAYSPVLDALGWMCRHAAAADVPAVLTRHAPSWVIQMPGLVSAGSLPELRERTLGSTSKRMVREVTDALERLSETALVVLALEDLHWSDPSTISLVAALARRQDPARLLVIVTYRTDDPDGPGRAVDALAQDLELRGHGQVIRPRRFSARAIAETVAHHLPGLSLDDDLASLIRHRTSGNPLFAHALLDHWRSTGAVRRDERGWQIAGSADAFGRGIPDTLRAMLQRRLQGVSPDHVQLLEEASLVGTRFSSVLLSAIAKRDVEEVEAACVALAAAGFLAEGPVSTWPDGTVAGEYAFTHALYHEVLSERVPPGRRARLHLAIGRHLESLPHTGRSVTSAAELAHHFSAGGDQASAIRYLKTAAEQALERSAHREAAGYLRRGLALVDACPDLPDRRQVEFDLHAMLAPTAIALEGFASAEAERSFARARVLGGELDRHAALSPLLFGRAMMHELRGEYLDSEAVLQERLDLCRTWRLDDTSTLVASEPLMACSLFHQGRFPEALEHAERGVELYEPGAHLGLMAVWGENAGVACLGWSALSLWFLGHADRAVERAVSAVTLSEAPGHLFSLASARAHGAHVHQLRRDVAQTQAWAEATRQVAEPQGYLYSAGFAQVLQGWAHARQGATDDGPALMREGLTRLEAIGALLDRPYLLALLAEVQIDAGLFDDAGQALNEAFDLVRRSRACFYEAELIRLQAAAIAQQGGDESEAESRLRQAIEVARRQDARSLELRAAVDLGRLLAGRGALRDARRLVRPLVRAFEDSAETEDLVRARELLA